MRVARERHIAYFGARQVAGAFPDAGFTLGNDGTPPSTAACDEQSRVGGRP